MDEASVQRGLQKALGESSAKGVKTKHDTELAPTDSDASSRSGSPDQCCPICLGKFKDKSFSDGCFHRFCFQCIREWAKVKSTCPLCKTPFKSIIHNVVSSDVYDQYVLQPTENGSLELDRNGARFRYHTTLSTNRRSAWETRMDQLFNRQARLAERIHRENEARQRRQLIYAASLRVHHIAANRFTRFRDTSPQFFRENPAVTHRLIPWLRRDLGVLFNGNDQHVRFMTQYILSLLPNVDIQSEEFHNHLRPFLYGRTEHFIHEFTSFARSPHDMDTYDQMAQYDFRPENPQFTATLRPHHPLVAQEHSTSEESENNHSNNNDIIVISDDDESDGDPVILPTVSSRSSSLRHEFPGPSSATDRAGPSTSYDLAATHNPEPPASRHNDQPGPSGVVSSGSLQIKQEHDSAYVRRKSEVSADSSGSIEIVGYQKPFHLRTPIAFITISDESSDNNRAPESKGKLSRNKERLAPRRSLGEEKAGGKRKQKTKHTRSLHSSNRAGNWSTDSDDSYYSRSRNDGYYRRSRGDDRDGPCTSRYISQNKSSSHRRPSRSPNELFRKVREEEGKWSLYYETRHDNRSHSTSGRSRSPSKSKSSNSRRYREDNGYNENSRSRDYYKDLPRPLRDERSSRSRERSRNRSRHYREDDYRRSRSRSRSVGRSVDFFSDDSKFSSRYGSRYGSTSSTFSKHSHQDSHAPYSSKKDISSSSHVSTSKASRSPELKRMREDDDDQSKGGESHQSKKHKHKHRHHKKKSSRHKHKSKSRDKESKSRKKDSKHRSGSQDKNIEPDKEKAIVESISDSTVENGEKDMPCAASQTKAETAHRNGAEPRNITLQDLLNMDEGMTFERTLSALPSDKGSGSTL